MLTIFWVSLVFSASSDVIFDCNFQYHTFEFDIGTLYECEAKVFLDSNESNDLVGVTGTHLEEKAHIDVEAISISHQREVSVFPRRMEGFFANIKVIIFLNTSLASLSPADLQAFPDLLSLSIADSNLASIPGDLFQHNPRIRFINFSFNQITQVGHDLVTHLDDLRHLDFLGNLCVDRLAQDSEEITELNELLPAACPQLEESECSCSDEIDFLSRKLDDQSEEFKRLLEEQMQEIDRKLDRVAREIMMTFMEVCAL